MKALMEVKFPWMEANRRTQDANDLESMKYSKQEDNLNQNFKLVEDAMYEMEKKIEALEKVVKVLGG